MPTQSLPENEEFQIFQKFSIFFQFLGEKNGKDKDSEEVENLIANDDW